jgi:RNA polymerase sigma-70 factor (ECF subfamily)
MVRSTVSDERIDEARSAWPMVAFDEAFRAYVAARDGAHVADLYLAWGCATAQAAALTAFEKTHLRELDAAWRAIAPDGVSLEDARQRFRERLFVGPTPAITSYKGKGTLASWARVAATRMLLDLVKRPRREISADDEFWGALPLAGADPHLELAKSSYRAVFKESLAEAARALLTRERNLLRYAVVEGLTIDQIATIYGVHRATAARRLESARVALRTHLRDILKERLKTTDRELDEMIGLLESQLEVSLERVLERKA